MSRLEREEDFIYARLRRTMPRTPAFCYLASTRLSMVSYASKRQTRPSQRPHAVNPNKYAPNSCYASNETPRRIVCILMPSLGYLSMLRGIPKDWVHPHPAPALGIIHSDHLIGKARLLSMDFDQGFCHETAARHVGD